MKSRRITLIVAVVLALAMGVLTLRYLTSVTKQSAAPVADMKPIVIASVPIPIHAKFKPQMLTRVMRPENTIEPGTIDDPKEVEGDIALMAIPQGGALTQSKVGIPATVGVAGRLRPGQRAVSIPVDMVKSVSGLIEPGDRVDVMASQSGSATGGPRTLTIIRGAMLLAVNSTIDQNAAAAGGPGATPAPAAGAPVAPTTVTLAVSPAQADLLTVADLNTTLRLALRSPDEAVGSLPAEHLSLAVAPAVIPNPSAVNATAAAPPAVAVPQSKPAARAVTDGVVFIDGDKSSLIPR